MLVLFYFRRKGSPTWTRGSQFLKYSWLQLPFSFYLTWSLWQNATVYRGWSLYSVESGTRSFLVSQQALQLRQSPKKRFHVFAPKKLVPWCPSFGSELEGLPSWSCGSIATSGNTILTKSAEIKISLFLSEGYPPALQVRAWSTLKDLPQTQSEDRWAIVQPYPRHKVSLKADLCNTKTAYAWWSNQ